MSWDYGTTTLFNWLKDSGRVRLTGLPEAATVWFVDEEDWGQLVVNSHAVSDQRVAETRARIVHRVNLDAQRVGRRRPVKRCHPLSFDITSIEQLGDVDCRFPIAGVVFVLLSDF